MSLRHAQPMGGNTSIIFALDNISDLEKLLNPAIPVTSIKIARHDPCPGGREKKFKKCRSAPIAT